MTKINTYAIFFTADAKQLIYIDIALIAVLSVNYID